MAHRRPHPVLRFLAVLLPLLAVIVGVAVVGGNTFGRSWLEHQVRDRIAAAAPVSSPPTVELRDRLVAWSVLCQRFDEVHVVLPGLQLAQDDKIVRADVDLVLRDVAVSERFTRYVAGSLTGTTRFSWQQVSAVIGQDVRPAAGGRVALSYGFTIAGVRVTAQVSAKPELDATGALYLTGIEVVVAGIQVPGSVVKQITDTLVRPIPLGLPRGIEATSVTAEESGVVFGLTGHGVDLTALR